MASAPRRSRSASKWRRRSRRSCTICRRARIPTPRRLRQQLAEQKAEVKETDLPKDKPTETEDPDRVVTQNDPKKPKEDDPKIAAVQTAASTGVGGPGSHRTAELDRECARAEKATAPSIGIGKDRQKLTADWGERSALISNCTSDIRQDKKKAATVKVSLVLNRLGQRGVRRASLKSSGDSASTRRRFQ